MVIKKYFMKSVKRITKDFKQKELLPLKLVFFVQASTISVLYPYLTIHMRELGINVEEAAIMSAVIPVIGIIMPPLAGMVADKIGNFKLLLAFFSLIGGVASLLLLFVPAGRITVTYPEKITLDVGCDAEKGGGFDNQVHLQWRVSSNLPCDEMINLNASDFSLEGCGFACSLDSENPDFKYENLTDFILKGSSYIIQILTPTGIISQQYNITKDEVPKDETKEDALTNRIMANEDHLKKSIRKLSSSLYFFPTNELTNINCKYLPNETSLTSGGMESLVCEMQVLEKSDGEHTANAFKGTKLFLQKLSKDDNLYTSEFKSKTSNTSTPVTCANLNSKSYNEISVYVHNAEKNLEIVNTFSLSKCKPQCLVTTLRKNLCKNLKTEVLYDPQLTFWIYLVIRVFIGIIGSTSYAMYEVAVIAILREQNADYGLQRIYASIGGMISSPLSGILIDYASQGKGFTDFRPAFYLYAALKISTSILMLFINLEFKQAASNVIKDAITVLKNLEIIALLAACFVLGSAWGYIESFLFWFLEDLGGTRSLMGITITVGGLAGIPLLILSGPIIDKIGHANVIFIGFVFYAIRLVGYSTIYNPYHCLYFEAMESITSSLAITAAITYAAKLSTTTTDGSIQGLVGGLYFGVGRGAGSLVGGYLMKIFGTRETYRIFAVFTMSTGIIYYLFNKFYILKRPQREGNEICKKEPKIKKDVESNIITEKPKIDNAEIALSENNNTTTEKESEKKTQDEVTRNVSDEKSKEDKKENEEKGCHTNSGFETEENNLKEDDTSKKKQV